MRGCWGSEGAGLRTSPRSAAPRNIPEAQPPELGRLSLRRVLKRVRQARRAEWATPVATVCSALGERGAHPRCVVYSSGYIALMLNRFSFFCITGSDVSSSL